MTMVIDLNNLIDFREKHTRGDTIVSVVSSERGVLIRVVCEQNGSVVVTGDEWRIVETIHYKGVTLVYVEGVGKVGTIL